MKKFNLVSVAMLLIIGSAANADMPIVNLQSGQSAVVGGVQILGEAHSTGGVQVFCDAMQPRIFQGQSTFVRNYDCLANTGNSDFQTALARAKQSAQQQCTSAAQNTRLQCSEQGYDVQGGKLTTNHICTMTFKYILN